MHSDALTILVEISPTHVQILTRSGKVLEDVRGADACERAEQVRGIIEAGLRGERAA